MSLDTYPPKRKYSRCGGRPGLDVDFVAVCDATELVKNGGGGTVADVARKFGISRGWIIKWVYPALTQEPDRARPYPHGGKAL